MASQVLEEVEVTPDKGVIKKILKHGEEDLKPGWHLRLRSIICIAATQARLEVRLRFIGLAIYY